jgi:hypothetical protein
MKYVVSHKENPQEYRRLQSLARRKENPLNNAYATAKSRSKKNGVDFDIELSDLKIPDVCPVFGIPIYFVGGKRTDNSPSLDRKDNSKGYVKGNVHVISWLANCRKGDLTLEQAEALVKYMKGI